MAYTHKGGDTLYVRFEPGEKYSRNLSDMSDTHESFDDAGYVLTDTDYVVDIDEVDQETIKKIITAFDIKTQTVWTTRGVHFYFKKSETFKKGANAISPLGFPFEIKHSGNTKAITIKQNGKLRQIDNEGIREDVPFIFQPTKRFDILMGISDGDGRNNKMFQLRSRLGTQTQWRKILNFINEYIFDEPMGQDEMNALTREMVVSAEKDNENEMADYLIKKLNFLKYGERYYFKYGEKYTHEESKLVRTVYRYCNGMKTRYVEEVVKQMKWRCPEEELDQTFKVKLGNGYLENGEFVEINIDDFTPYCINIQYNPNAKPVQEVDNYINHLTGNDQGYRDFLLEILGHCLIVNAEFKRLLAKFFIFVGDGGNGKGTLLQIIKTILGLNNVTGMGIKQLADERYIPAFKGMLANLGDDIQDQAINDNDMRMLKNISTCDLITSRELYKSAENTYFTGTLIFTSNHILKSWEKGKSYERRVVWLPMYSKVVKKDPLFITKLTTNEALEYWLKLIVDGYMRLYEKSEFTIPKVVDDFNKDYHRENNPVLDYLEDMTAEDFDGIPIRDVYDDYESWCEDNATKFNQKLIKDTIQQLYGLTVKVKKINGKSTKCFTRS